MEFHPNMLGRQGPPTAVQRPRSSGFHPNMLSSQQLAGLGSATPTIAQSVQFDAAQGTVTIGGNVIKIVPAVVSAILVKLIFFGGAKAAQGAKALGRKLRGSSSPQATATNPKRSQRPWQAVRFNPAWRKMATKRHKTKAAAERWATEHGGPGRSSYVG